MKTPDHAAKVWFVDGVYHVELIDDGIGHTVQCSASDCLELIRNRTQSSKIGTAGSKTQHQIDTGAIVETWLQQFQPAKRKSKFTPEERRDAKDLLRRCGLIGG